MMHYGRKSHRRPDRPFLPRSARLGNVRPCPIPQSEQSDQYWSLDTASQHHKHAWPRSAHNVEAQTGYCRRRVEFFTCPRAFAADLSASRGLGISDLVCDLTLPRLIADSYSPFELWRRIRRHIWTKAHTTAMARRLSRHKRESA
jgi:hypothetical protein